MHRHRGVTGAVRGRTQPNPCPLGRLAPEIEAATQTIDDDAVDDMQAKTGTALMTAGREKRIESLPPHVRTHAATVVGENDFNIVRAGGAHLDIDRPLPGVRKRMRDRIEKQVGQDLPVGAGIAVHRQIRLALNIQAHAVLRQRRPKANGELLGQIAEVERSQVGIISVCRHLLERLDQFGRPVQADEKLRGCVLHGIDEIVQARALERSKRGLRGKQHALSLQR